jgi:hypothetical protein
MSKRRNLTDNVPLKHEFLSRCGYGNGSHLDPEDVEPRPSQCDLVGDCE